MEFCVDSGDTMLADHFSAADINSTYRYKTTKNNIIEIFGDEIRDHILKTVEREDFFSIRAGKVADLSNT